jgi:hypothetical protein
MLCGVVVVAVTLIPIAVAAQTDTGAKAPAPTCWRGKPLPQCRAFWITEMAGGYAFVTTKTNYALTFGSHVETRSKADESSQLLWTIGPMFNTAPARAFGVTLSAGLVNEGGREAIELRRRRWMTAATSLDFSAGALRMDIPKSPGRPTGAAYGLTTGIYLGGVDLVHLDGHADVVFASNRIRGGATAGGGFGGYGAVAGTALLATLAVALALAIAGGDF